MKQRLLVAAVGVPLLIVVLVLLPPIATAILTAAIAGAAAWELLHTACRQPKLLYVPTILCAALVVLAIVFGTAITATLIYAFFYVMFLFYMAVSTHGKETAIPFADVAVCIVAGFLFPAMYSCIGLLRNGGLNQRPAGRHAADDRTDLRFPFHLQPIWAIIPETGNFQQLR